jgi:hypothetical protein
MLRLLFFLAFVVIAFMVALAVTRYFTSKGKREYAAVLSKLEEIKGLPVREAMTRVADLLDRGELLRGVRSPDTTPMPEGLPPLLRGFFEQWASVETTKGQITYVRRSEIGPSTFRTGFLSLGRGMGATDVEYEVAIRPGKEEVVELSAEEEPDPVFGTHPSIYHWLIAVASEVKEAGLERGTPQG